MQVEIDEPTLAEVGFWSAALPPRGYAPPCDGATPTRSQSGRGRKGRCPEHRRVQAARLRSSTQRLPRRGFGRACVVTRLSKTSDRPLRAVTEMGNRGPRICRQRIVVLETRYRRRMCGLVILHTSELIGRPMALNHSRNSSCRQAHSSCSKSTAWKRRRFFSPWTRTQSDAVGVVTLTCPRHPIGPSLQSLVIREITFRW
jgi:hypothetical protein